MSTDRADHDRRIDYLELGGIDLPALKSFYSTAFGWTFTDYGPDYVAFADGRLEGGFRKVDEVRDGGALIVLYATDLEACQQAIEDAGGKIERPIFPFPGGRRFHFRDPSGNELAVWSDPLPT